MARLRGAGVIMERLITHNFSLADIAEGYRLMAAGETGKVMIHY